MFRSESLLLASNVGVLAKETMIWFLFIEPELLSPVGRASLLPPREFALNLLVCWVFELSVVFDECADDCM